MNLARIFFVVCTFSTSVFAADAPMIRPVEAAKLVSEGKAVLVDCREPREWKSTGVAEPRFTPSWSENSVVAPLIQATR